MKITCHRKIDTFKHNWFLWEATRQNDDGTVDEGTVEADNDGDLIASETFEKE